VALIRTLILGLIVYGGFAVCFPDWTGAAYHAMLLSMIAGGAVGIWLFGKVIDIGSGTAKIALELAFAGVIALFLGYTMPQKSGKPPLQQWAEGARPNQAAARKGFDRLGVNPNGALASRLVKLFPAR